MSKQKVISAVKKKLARVGHGIEFDIVDAGVRAKIPGGTFLFLPTKMGRT